MTTRTRSRRVGVAAAIVLLACAGCGGTHEILNPKGQQAKSIAGIGWFMIISATAVTVLVFGALLHGALRRRRTDGAGGRRAFAVNEQTYVIAGGIALPAVFILVLTGMSLHTLKSQPSGDLHVTVVGHQYWWEVRYPDLGVTTANEIHIPVGQDVDVTLESVDVIHSFWVPNLAGKIDMIPGHTNHLTLHADATGQFRGQCAEFCGLQHANMIFFVDVDTPSAFDQWTAHERAPAATPPSGSVEAKGEQAFSDLPCASCHTIEGTPATGTVGPDLTHFAERSTIGAGAVPNTRGYLGGWIADAQAIKPGNLMPPIPMSPDQLNSLLAYLGTLR